MTMLQCAAIVAALLAVALPDTPSGALGRLLYVAAALWLLRQGFKQEREEQDE